MKKLIVAVIFAFALYGISTAQDVKYRRSSLYSIMISHTKEQFSKEIEDEFLNIPIPEKFDNHDLSIKVITSEKGKEDVKEISSFLEQNKVASRLVGRWYNRDPKTGECDMKFIADRGLYAANYRDVAFAKLSNRGLSLLKDDGENLIPNTFVMVNDIHYFDKNKGAQVGAAAVRVGFAVLSVLAAFAGANVGDLNKLGDQLADLISKIQGFSVTVNTYLFRLEWNDQIAGEFYSSQYVDRGRANETKRLAFENSTNYKLKYVGCKTVKADDVTMAGLSEYDLSAMIRKVCTRAIDKSIVALQKTYDEFKVETPVYSVSGDVVKAQIGMKEGVTEDCTYEVLEAQQANNGKISYHRVATVQPVKGKICDNRYMASFENTEESKLTETTFKKLSGGSIREGMLIREITTK